MTEPGSRWPGKVTSIESTSAFGRSTRALAASKRASIACFAALNRWPYARRADGSSDFKPLLGRLEPPLLLAEELDPGRLDRGRITGLGKRRDAPGFEGFESGDRVFGLAHGRDTPRR